MTELSADSQQPIGNIGNLDANAFLQDFFTVFVRNGYGALPKREIELLVLELLLKHSSTWSSEEPPTYELARLLRISPRRLRSLLDDLAYRDAARDENWCRKQLRDILKKSEKIKHGTWIAVQIDDGLIRDFATATVRREFGIVDTSFNTAIVKLTGEKFGALAASVLEPEEWEPILEALDTAKMETEQDPKSPKSAIRLFIDAFATSAGEEAGKQTVDLGFTLLSGGTNKILGAINAITGQS